MRLISDKPGLSGPQTLDHAVVVAPPGQSSELAGASFTRDTALVGLGDCRLASGSFSELQNKRV